MRKSLFKMGVVTLLMLLVAGAALADAEPKRLQVSGTAVVTGDPDIAYITVGVETQNPSAEKAAQDNASIMAQVLAALREMGLTEKEVIHERLQHLGFHPDGQPRTDKEETVTTYWVQNRINITTKNLDSVGEIVDRAVKAGANQVQGIRFDVQDKQALQLEALKLAVQQGMGKAEAMAEAAGGDPWVSW